MEEADDRNLVLDLVRTTEAAALFAAPWKGRGDKNASDQAAVNGMRVAMSTVPMSGVVVIGEGEKDHAPMLYIGEQVGAGGCESPTGAVMHRSDQPLSSMPWPK